MKKLKIISYALMSVLFAIVALVCYPVRFVGGLAVNCFVSCLNKLPHSKPKKSIKEQSRSMNQNKKLKNK